MMESTAVSRIYYSIKEVASALEEVESTLRYWEGEFPDTISPHRNKRGVRFYSEKDMDDVRLIKYLIRDCGLTLDGARKRLKNNKEGAVKQARVVAYLKNIKAELKSLQKAMDEVEKNGSSA
jgi:DNA-binding transcriptional MerR regulator